MLFRVSGSSWTLATAFLHHSQVLTSIMQRISSNAISLGYMSVRDELRRGMDESSGDAKAHMLVTLTLIDSMSILLPLLCLSFARVYDLPSRPLSLRWRSTGAPPTPVLPSESVFTRRACSACTC